jgi:hypothetical protein
MRRLLFLLLTIPTTAMAATPFPGGVLDTAGRAAYLASEAGIDAVDLAQGGLLWRSREAQLPLAVAGGRLHAMGFHPTNQLTAVTFDLAGQGKRVFKTDVTDLPRWVATRGTATQSFRQEWKRLGEEIVLDWRAEARGESGPAKVAAGQVRIDLESGRVRSSPLTPTDSPPERMPLQLEKHALRWHGQAGGQLLAVVLEDLPGSTAAKRPQRLVFRAWDARTGKESTPRELMRGERLAVLTDLDGKHAWLRDAGGQDDAARPWAVVSVLDGHLVARVPFVPGTQGVTRLGDRAYCLTTAPAKTALGDGPPRRVHTLHAIDLADGKVAWTHRLGDQSGLRSRTR